LKFAIGVPNVREYADPRLLLDLAVSTERSGWDGFFLWDHLLYRPGDPVVDPWTVVSAIASVTDRIRLGVMVTALARRRPWRVAREVATLDVLSGGRVVFGAGLGSLPDEWSRFGEDPDARIRADKLDEGLQIIEGLWSGRALDHAGTQYSVEDVLFLPRPLQQPRVPIWVAGRWPNRRPFRRAARWDGIFATHEEVGHNDNFTPEQLRELVDYTMQHRGDRTAPFDVIVEGHTPNASARAGEGLGSYAGVGLTWWVEKLGWFRGSVEEMRDRVAAGPPVL
jgi:alkanesulfonate monooxygenase SsuD/methylene tetrahydromethanopterin reductase-like flavin-dependent oxidoreductase (luciferase family)